MVKTESLGGIRGGFVAGFFDFVDLFFGVTAGFSEKDFATFDARSFDVVITMLFVNFSDFSFEIIKDKL